jgi:hypothetical protein
MNEADLFEGIRYIGFMLAGFFAGAMWALHDPLFVIPALAIGMVLWVFFRPSLARPDVVYWK